MDTCIDNDYLSHVRDKFTNVLRKMGLYNLNTIYSKEKNTGFVECLTTDKVEIDSFITDFRKLPLTSYKDYKPFIDRIYNNGENDILSKGYPIWFAKSGGTTGTPKTFPIYSRPEELSELKGIPDVSVITRINEFIDQKISLYPTGLSLIWKTPKSYSPHKKVPVGFATSLIETPNNDFEPREIKYIVNHNDHLKISLLFNLLEKSLEYIFAPFVNILVDLFSVLENNIDLFIKCYTEKVFIQKNELESDIDEKIINKLSIDFENLLKDKDSTIEDVLKILRKCKSHKEFQDIGIKIWPNIKIISTTYSSITLEQHLKLLKYFISEKPFYANVAYGCSESFIGLPVYFHPTGYRVIDQIYPEFIPYSISKDEYESQDIKSVWQVESNRTYEIVVTNYNGYYRYKIGDIVKVIGWLDYSPVIEFVKRIGWSLVVGGYRIGDEYVIKGINNSDLPIKYSVAYNNVFVRPAGFGYFVELESDYYSSDSENNVVNITKNKIENAETQINEYFSDLNEFYRDAVNQKKISKTIIKIVPKNSFHKYKQRKANISKSSSLAQIKIPIAITDTDSVEFFNSISNNIHIQQ